MLGRGCICAARCEQLLQGTLLKCRSNHSNKLHTLTAQRSRQLATTGVRSVPSQPRGGEPRVLPEEGQVLARVLLEVAALAIHDLSFRQFCQWVLGS